jgi:hypothetical protein
MKRVISEEGTLHQSLCQLQHHETEGSKNLRFDTEQSIES